MFDEVVFGSEFFEGLERTDAAIAEAVRVGRCPRCGGPLHRGDFGRKPRGGLMAAAGEAQVRRYSFCCGQEGCRRRATPPSVRFMGRRVYLEAVVVVASVLGRAFHRPKDRHRATGVPARTVGRWCSWWAGPFVTTAVFAALRARLVTSLPRAALPRVILERMPGSAADRVGQLGRWLASLTTASVSDGSRFLGGIA